MEIKVRRSSERGFADHGWLKSRHTFSFANYYDIQHMGFGPLRVINEDRIDGGTGFNTHPHRDMEIISYVIAGALEHRDSMGHRTIIKPGEVQRMSAGTGIQHSEHNHSKDQVTHFLQIWIVPNIPSSDPGYGQKDFSGALNKNQMVLTCSPNGRDGSITIQQDADIYIVKCQVECKIPFTLRSDRGLWIQVIKGDLTIAGQTAHEGDGLALKESGTNESLEMTASSQLHMILFDLKIS